MLGLVVDRFELYIYYGLHLCAVHPHTSAPNINKGVIKLLNRMSNSFANLQIYILLLAFLISSLICMFQFVGFSWKIIPKRFSHDLRVIVGKIG